MGVWKNFLFYSTIIMYFSLLLFGGNLLKKKNKKNGKETKHLNGLKTFQTVHIV